MLRTLKGLDTPVILMKRLAYAIAGLPPAHGSIVGDLDLMVPVIGSAIIERTLVARGYNTVSELEP